MDKLDEKLLEASGWVVECGSPFEIRTEDGSFATNEAAQIVLWSLRDEYNKEDIRNITIDEDDDDIIVSLSDYEEFSPTKVYAKIIPIMSTIGIKMAMKVIEIESKGDKSTIDIATSRLKRLAYRLDIDFQEL